VRALRRYARRLLVYLYYDLDNRPKYFRLLLLGVTGARRALSKIRRPRVRKLVAVAGANLVYKPIVLLGRALQPFGLARHLPLYEFYRDRSRERIEQDVYDRFFTPIEQRVSRQEILDLRDTFAEITVSDALPYWHFLAVR
jgi:hypothetical protein